MAEGVNIDAAMIYDTLENIQGQQATSVKMAYAHDIGCMMFDQDGDWTQGSDVLCRRPPDRWLHNRLRSIEHKNCLATVTIYLLLIGCVSSGRPWIPPKETPQAAQAWEKTKNPELKIEWIFIDEQFVEVKNSTLPDLSESDRDKFMVPDSFKPQPQRFLESQKKYHNQLIRRKTNRGGVLITLYTAQYQSKKVIFGMYKLATSLDQRTSGQSKSITGKT